MSQGFGVRLFKIHTDGSLEPIFGADLDHFGGACPNVGDTIAKWRPKDAYDFFSVQRRYFVDSSDGAEGWAIIVKEVEPATPMRNVVEAWNSDTKFWREVDAQEERERTEETRKLIDKLVGSKKPKGRKKPTAKRSPKKTAKEKKLPKQGPASSLAAHHVKVLRFMIDHPDCTTPDVIPNAGERTMEALAKLGALKEVGRDFRGMREWVITDEARTEIERVNAWLRGK